MSPSPLSPGSDRTTIIKETSIWDPQLAQCLNSEAVVPLNAPFNRTSFVLALGHMKQRVLAQSAKRGNNTMPDQIVLSICESRPERSALAAVLRSAAGPAPGHRSHPSPRPHPRGTCTGKLEWTMWRCTPKSCRLPWPSRPTTAS
jgi:hypothetical protein